MKKIVALLLAVVMMVAVFAACGNTEKTTEKTDTEQKTETPEKETLVMGTNAAFPPYEFVDDNNNIVGIDAEIAAAVAEKLGMNLEIKDMEFDSLVPAVAAGSIDIALAGMTVNDERLLSVNFSNSYAKGVQVIVVKEGGAVKTADDLFADGASFVVGVQAGTTGDIYCTDDLGQDRVKQYTNGALAVEALKNGQVDCVVIDNEPAKNFVKANEGLSILDTTYADEDYAAAIAKENTELLENFNKALDELKNEGKLQAIIDKYIPAE